MVLNFSQLKIENIMVFGGSGFLGARIVTKLIKYCNNLHIVVRKSSNLHRIQNICDKFELYNGDLTDSNFFTDLIEKIKPTLIFYTVGHGAYRQQSDREQIFRSNLLCTHNLLMATLSVPNCRIIYAGTSLEQGALNHPIKEEGITNPISCYGAMKTASTIIMMQAALYEKRRITILNPFAIYGIGEPLKRLIPTVIQAAISGNELNLTQSGLVRDYVFVDDVVEAFLMAAITNSSISEKINIAGGRCVSNEQVVEIIEKLMNIRIKKNIGAYKARATDTQFWRADVSKAKQILGWQAKNTMEQGLKATIEWMQNNEK